MTAYSDGFLFLPGDVMTVEGALADLKISGTELYDTMENTAEYSGLVSNLDALYDEWREIYREDKEKADSISTLIDEADKAIDTYMAEYVKANPDNLLSGFFITRLPVKESLAAVAQIAREFDLFVLCDEVYRQLSYATEIPQFSTRYPDLKDRVLVIQSFSKPYAMTGWRVGYLLADGPVKRQLEKLHQYDVVSTVSFLQEACITALEQDPSPMRETYRRRRDFTLSRLSEMGLPVVRPEGAFYVFPDISEFGLDSGTFCRRMIQEAQVAAVPGFCFGAEGHIRLSYCCDDGVLAEGLARLGRFVDKLREAAR